MAEEQNLEVKTIAVVGGVSGIQPHSVIEALLSLKSDPKNECNFKIRALTRDAYKPDAQKLRHRGVEVIESNSLDKLSLLQAFQDCWGVFGYTSPFLNHNIFDKNHQSLQNEIQQGINIIDAAIECKVSYFVFGSTSILRHETKDEVEKYLLSKEKEFKQGIFIIRPLWFMDNIDKFISIDHGYFSLSIPNNYKLQWISFHDVAMITAQSFCQYQQFSKIKILNIASQELSMDEIASILSKESKEKVIYKQNKFYNRLLSKLSKKSNSEMSLIFDNYENDKKYEANIKQCHELFPNLQTFEQYAQYHFHGKDFGNYHDWYNQYIQNIGITSMVGATIGLTAWYLFKHS